MIQVANGKEEGSDNGGGGGGENDCSGIWELRLGGGGEEDKKIVNATGCVELGD